MTARAAGLPLVLLVPPAVVVVTLLVPHSVWATFVGYHLGICVLAPMFAAVVSGRRSWRAYAGEVGLSGGRVREGVRTGLILGAVMAAVQIVALVWGADVFFADERVTESLSSWGAGPAQAGPLLLIMLVLNGPAEELYWRGYVHGRLGGMRGRRLAIAVAALAYASYHGVTIYALFGSLPVAASFFAAVWGAGCFWGWLRERYGNVWPALLAHGGATLGYMFVYWDRYVRA
ncbi:CPBP family intramembrane metalloprotease [bacterium]|nr:CPBP family intramembrane metalloprotease [bacterium]MBU1073457.1 CPBP family intramembrane metalloprotease [bacterium]